VFRVASREIFTSDTESFDRVTTYLSGLFYIDGRCYVMSKILHGTY
jgi:hypothetical protein